ncbi:E3 ubiquitin-protein ligase DTX3L-like [Hoplias malabaricus]|uniref:E3 ubiquitin-protein ligase DTX3L-like n=1 Tax=Hoplias malabaricus TaxID=27720 RepID=UPI00346255B8
MSHDKEEAMDTSDSNNSNEMNEDMTDSSHSNIGNPQFSSGHLQENPGGGHHQFLNSSFSQNMNPAGDINMTQGHQSSKMYPDLTPFQMQHQQHTALLSGAEPLQEKASSELHMHMADFSQSSASNLHLNSRHPQTIPESTQSNTGGVHHQIINTSVPQDSVQHVNTAITDQPLAFSSTRVQQASSSMFNFPSAQKNYSEEHQQEEDLYRSGDENPKDPREDNAPDDAGATFDSGAKPSAPQDTATFYINVECKLPLPDVKWKSKLQIALQTWSSGTLSENVRDNCDIIDIQLMPENPCIGKVVISPLRALEALKIMKKANLTFKGTNFSTVVHFLFDKPKPVYDPKEQKVQHTPAKEEQMKEPMPELDRVYTASAAVRHGQNRAEMPQNTETNGAPQVTVPLFHYWYLSRVFGKELSHIEKTMGIKINTEVSVFFSAEDKKSNSVYEAVQQFTDLYQQSTNRLQSVKIPQTQMESDIMKEVMHNIPSDQAKMMLNMSADECLLFAPEHVISRVQKELKVESGMQLSRSFSKEMPNNNGMDTSDVPRSSRSWSPKTERTLEMDIKDSKNSMEIKEMHWNLMKNISGKQLQDIQNKYGVKFFAQTLKGVTEVTVRSRDNQPAPLETHALRAFEHLYQKVAMSAVTCSVKGSSEAQAVGQALQQLGAQNYFVEESEKNNCRLVGLPKHLAPAIADVEELLGKPVFDYKIKQILGNPGDFPRPWIQQRAAKWMPGTSSNSQTEENDLGRGATGKEKEYDKSKDENCPICMDQFTNRTKLKCGHEFCKECLESAKKSMGQICPVCKDIFGTLIGTQPEGKMTICKQRYHLPGFSDCGTIEINYYIQDGIQTDRHPNPGKHYMGTGRKAYLPDNAEGNHVLNLLQRAFKQKLIFTVGTSSTTGAQNAVIWNDIHHKTNTTGGPSNYGYPDPDYLRRVKEELKAKGIE